MNTNKDDSDGRLNRWLRSPYERIDVSIGLTSAVIAAAALVVSVIGTLVQSGPGGRIGRISVEATVSTFALPSRDFIYYLAQFSEQPEDAVELAGYRELRTLIALRLKNTGAEVIDEVALLVGEDFIAEIDRNDGLSAISCREGKLPIDQVAPGEEVEVTLWLESEEVSSLTLSHSSGSKLIDLTGAPSRMHSLSLAMNAFGAIAICVLLALSVARRKTARYSELLT